MKGERGLGFYGVGIYVLLYFDQQMAAAVARSSYY
jgi:hypothetical protein